MSTQIPLFETKPNASTRAEDLPADVGHGLNARDFEVVADASGSGRRLRELVLGLALRGRLSRADLHGLTRATIAWPSVQLGDVADCVLGKMLDRSKHTTGTSRPYLRNINVRWHSFDLGDLSEMFFEDKELVRYGAKPGDVLVCEGGEPGRAAVWTDTRPMLIQKAIHRVRPSEELLGSWVVLNLRYDTWNGRLESLFTGATIKHFTGKALSSYEIPLPPVAEQKRIIAKVDQLTSLCEQLEAKQTEKQALGSRLTKASLEALTTAETPEEFALAWKRVSENFDTLIDRSEKVEDLRRAILEVAIRGRLISRSTSSEPVDALLETVNHERRLLIEGKRKGGRGSSSNETSEPLNQPFEVPGGWRWCFLGEIAGHIVDGTHHTPRYVDEGMDFISAKDIRNGAINFEGCRQISVEEFDLLTKRCCPKRGDILVTKSGSIGAVAVIETDRRFTLFESVAVVPIVPSLNSTYFSYVVYLGASGQFGMENQRGVAVRHLHLVDLRKLPCPIPPRAEQDAIVSKVQELMGICDRLENGLRRAEELAAKFAESVVRGVTA